jgi:hypothetical protein
MSSRTLSAEALLEIIVLIVEELLVAEASLEKLLAGPAPLLIKNEVGFADYLVIDSRIVLVERL